MKRYVVRSGWGYIFDSNSLQMVGNNNNPDEALEYAQRFSKNEAEKFAEELRATGAEAVVEKVDSSEGVK